MSRLATVRKTISSILVTGGRKDEASEDDGNTKEGAIDEEIDDGVEAGKVYA